MCVQLRGGYDRALDLTDEEYAQRYSVSITDPNYGNYSFMKGACLTKELISR